MCSCIDRSCRHASPAPSAYISRSLCLHFSLSLHTSLAPSAYISRSLYTHLSLPLAGAIRASKWIKGKTAGYYEMSDVLGL